MTLDDFNRTTLQEFPGFKLVYKEESLLMRFLAKLLWIVTFGQQKLFMTHFTTTVGQTIYVPLGWDLKNPLQQLQVLRHERIHMRQAARLTFPLFMFLYLVPFFPLGLAYGRARLEWEAYTESMRAIRDQYGDEALHDARFRQSIVDMFTTGQYGWMWPFPTTVDRWYTETMMLILAEPKG
jgi:hypothetical protein